MGYRGRNDGRKPKEEDHKIREEPLTYEDYAKLPDEGIRFELASGRLEAMTPAPSPYHQLLLQELADVIKNTCIMDYIVFIAPVDVILSDTEVRQPDLVLLHRSRLTLITQRGIEGPPDLVAEVLSLGSIKRDREDKRKSYALYGVPEYWIIDMNNALLEQYILENGAYTLFEVYMDENPVHTERVPCIRFTMKEILDRLPIPPD